MSPAGCVGRSRAASRAALWLPLIALTAHGCAPATVPPSPKGGLQAPPAAKTRPAPGYDARRDGLGAIDTTQLRGRRIVLDPGHGGFFRGAMGVNGLTEAEVNLGVANALRGLLEARGALVVMTRTDDRDFLTPADSALRSDLAERTRIANAAAPDLFVSIHHNADARGTHDVNETQTYYKLGDEGPSLDAAQSVHRYLVRNLGITKHRLLPGNYFVLRNSDSPGILTESSYITNPDVESKLALAAKQRLEAEALYLGLAHYFARQRPDVVAFAASAERDGKPDSVFRGAQAPYFQAEIAGPYDAFDMSLDGEPLAVTRHGPLLTAQARALESGSHTATLRVRLGGSGASRERRLAFRIQRPPESLAFTPLGLAAGPQGGIVPARLEVRDAARLLVRDSVAIRLVAEAAGVAPKDTVVIARDGVAWGYFRVSKGVFPAAIRARLGAARPDAKAATDARSARTTLASKSAPPANRATGFAVSMPGSTRLTDAPGTREPRPPDAWLNRDGFAAVSRDPSSGSVQVPRLAGYRLWPSDLRWPPRFTAIAGGALHGKRIVLDPEGGGDVDGGTGVAGSRAANVNLDVARVLAAMLEGAGAAVRVTREGDQAMSDVERVEASEAFHADRFVRIGHRAERPMVGYYFSSAPGKRWAERTSRRLADLGLGAPAPAEDAQYPLQQTSCPALFVSPARIDDPASEERLGAPGRTRAEAYAIYLALIGEWSDQPMPLDSLTVLDASGRPAAGAVVTLGLETVLQAGPDGVVRFAHTEPGPIVVEAVHSRVRARHVLLESESGIVLTGSEER